MANHTKTLLERARNALARSQELFESAPIALLHLRRDTTVLGANARFDRIFRGRVRLLGMRLGEHVAKADRRRLRAYLRGVLAGTETGSCDVALDSSSGALPVSLRAARVGDRLLVTVSPGSPAAYPPDGHQLQRLLRAQDEERRRLSLELHDELGQILGALEVGLARLEGTSKEVPVREIALQLRGLVRQSAIEVRRLSHGLHPRVLEDYGLRPAVERLVVDANTRRSTPVSLRIDDSPISGPSALAVYRVVQEALNNAIHHARASKVRVDLACADGRLTGVVADDGCGFEVDRRSLAGLGLQGMRERIERLGGVFSVTSRPGAGTAVRFEVPVCGEGGET